MHKHLIPYKPFLEGSLFESVSDVFVLRACVNLDFWKIMLTLGQNGSICQRAYTSLETAACFCTGTPTLASHIQMRTQGFVFKAGEPRRQATTSLKEPNGSCDYQLNQNKYTEKLLFHNLERRCHSSRSIRAWWNAILPSYNGNLIHERSPYPIHQTHIFHWKAILRSLIKGTWVPESNKSVP